MAVIDVKVDNFEEEVLKHEGKVLVDFNANWCGPCQMLKPIIEEYAEEKEDIKVVSVNIDDEYELAEEFGIMSIPCLVLFENGKEINRSIGLIPREKLDEFIGE